MRSGAFIVLALIASVASAQPVPLAERSEVVARWVAAAFIAEAGWADPEHPDQARDHRAIFYVMKRRWLKQRKRWPDRTFLDVVRDYVAAFDRRTTGPRSEWLRSLAERDAASDGVEPDSWPSKRARWSVHAVWWAEAVERARGCLRGRGCVDPYAGESPVHWGGKMDRPPKCTRPLPQRDTANVFYVRIPGCSSGVLRASIAR